MNTNPKLISIVAYTTNRVIGNKGELICKIAEDLKNFQNLTMGHVVVMGRKTFESIGKPLHGRTNVVLSNNPDYKVKGVLVSNSISDVIKSLDSKEKIFIIGGAEIYKQTIDIVDEIYATEINKEGKGDAYFPDIPNSFIEAARSTIVVCGKRKCDFVVYKKTNQKIRFNEVITIHNYSELG